MRVLILISLLLCLTACGTKTITKPEIVYLDRVEYIPVPADLLRTIPRQAIPESLTYGELIEVCSKDRATIGKLNGQLVGISSLGDPGERKPD